jgi:hypothetical protein
MVLFAGYLMWSSRRNSESEGGFQHVRLAGRIARFGCTSLSPESCLAQFLSSRFFPNVANFASRPRQCNQKNDTSSKRSSKNSESASKTSFPVNIDSPLSALAFLYQRKQALPATAKEHQLFPDSASTLFRGIRNIIPLIAARWEGVVR